MHLETQSSHHPIKPHERQNLHANKKMRKITLHDPAIGCPLGQNKQFAQDYDHNR